jgi:uncharacterized integral membrane protein
MNSKRPSGRFFFCRRAAFFSLYNVGIPFQGAWHMRYLVWLLRLVIFIIVLLFALKNTAPVDVGFFADQVLHQVPLIVVMLVAFVLGVVFGLLVAFSAVLRRRREINRLRRELSRAQDALAHPQPGSGPVIPEAVAPLAPL